MKAKNAFHTQDAVISMLDIYSETDITVCRQLWEHFIPPEKLTDIWDVRACFYRRFARKLFFVVAKKNGHPAGFIPLSYIDENDHYGYFPGEVWNGKTWLEQNRVIFFDHDILDQMLNWLSGNKKKYYIRYLIEDQYLRKNSVGIDEIGYFFYPKEVDFSMDNYYALFSKKSAKKIRRDVDNIYARDLVIRTDNVDDFDLMVQMNIERFGGDSYFSDQRFCESFRDLKKYLNKKGWLRITSVLVDGKPAAVDMGCLYKRAYTLLAGGTHSEYPGIAKVINLYHIQEACKNKYKEVDFLCGDFSWKKRFHLSPRPLYMIKNNL